MAAPVPEKGILSASAGQASSPPADAGPEAATIHYEFTEQTGTLHAPLPPQPILPAGLAVPGYEIYSELGRGGMGVVYKALQIPLNRVVALKMILAGDHAGEQDRARFRSEAEAVARLQHPNIVQIFDIGEQAGRPFFSLEYCAGGSLEKKLRGTPLPPPEAARLVQTLARAMQAAHQQHIIHRDLKPANVLLSSDGTPKITDFGLAKRLDEAGQTGSGSIMGTPSYMAPEQADGGPIGPAADVYALGAILYETLTGHPPFRGPTLVDTLRQVVTTDPVPPTWLQPRIPRDLETICLKCLEKSPAKRYASAQELADDLDRFLRDEPILARPVGPLSKALRWCRRNPGITALLGLVAGLLLLSFVNLQLSLASVQELALRNQQLLAESVAGRLDERIRSDAQAVALLSREAEVKRLLSAAPQQRSGHLPAVQEVLESVLQANPDFASAFVLAGDGLALASTNPAHPGRSYAFRDYFQQARQGKAYQSKILIGTSTYEPGMYYSAPVLDAAGAVLGVVVVKLDIHTLWRIVSSTDVSGVASALLLDEDGIIIAHRDPALLFHSLSPLSQAEQERIDPHRRFQTDSIPSLELNALAPVVRAKEAGHTDYLSPADGSRRRLAYAPLHERAWVLGIDMDLRQLSGEHSWLTWWRLALLALAIGVFGLPLIMLVRRGLQRA